MPSEWAKKTARETWGIFGGTSSKEPLIMAIAAELDAARIEGLEEAAKIAGNQHKEAIELRHGIGAIGGLLNVLNAIRTRIEEIKGA